MVAGLQADAASGGDADCTSGVQIGSQLDFMLCVRGRETVGGGLETRVARHPVRAVPEMHAGSQFRDAICLVRYGSIQIGLREDPLPDALMGSLADDGVVGILLGHGEARREASIRCKAVIAKLSIS